MIEELTEKLADTEISKTNPKNFEFWNDLPPEIKLECIEFMNYKERTRLSMTSHTENRLVGRLRYEFDAAFLVTDNIKLYRYHNKYTVPYTIYKERVELLPQHRWLQRRDAADFHKFLNFKKLKICVKKFESDRNFDGAHLLIKCLWNKTEKITLNFGNQEVDIDEFMGIPQIKIARELCLRHVKKEQVVSVIEKWIEFEKEIGSKFTIECKEEFTNNVISRFQTNQIPHKNPKLRVQTDYQKEDGSDDFGLKWRARIRCTVVASD